MFDAKSILDELLRGGSQPQRRNEDLSEISDLLKQLSGGGQGARPAAPTEMPSDSGADIAEERAAGRRRARPQEEASPGRAAPGGAEGGGLEDVLRDVLGGRGGGLGDILGRLGQGGGGLGDILGQVLGQATSGTREGASRLGEVTGGTRTSRDALSQLTGRSPEELLAQLKELVANNQLGTGVAIGGLGALILGTGTGRSLAATAARLGGLAVIGGLAYKAYQSYQQGRQPAEAGSTPRQALLAAPEGSGFEPGAASNDDARLLIRAMIAAAAADGRIDAEEQRKIVGGLEQAGITGAARQFLAREMANPATVDDLAAAVSSQEQAVQVFTAARVAVDPDLDAEHEFLAALAERLGIDDDLAAHIDSAARGAEA